MAPCASVPQADDVVPHECGERGLVRARGGGAAGGQRHAAVRALSVLRAPPRAAHPAARRHAQGSCTRHAGPQGTMILYFLATKVTEFFLDFRNKWFNLRSTKKKKLLKKIAAATEVQFLDLKVIL